MGNCGAKNRTGLIEDGSNLFPSEQVSAVNVSVSYPYVSNK